MNKSFSEYRRLGRSVLIRWLLGPLFVAAIAFGASSPGYGLVPPIAIVKQLVLGPLIRLERALPSEEIAALAELGRKTGGTREISLLLGHKSLSNEALEDAYLRIAIAQGKLERAEAEGVIIRLAGTPGLRSTISKIVGNSDPKTAGHLNELRIADNAAQKGFKVTGIGVRFHDRIKGAATDIDILLELRGRQVAIEAKDYTSSTPIPLDKFRADFISLREYVASVRDGRVLPVFSITNKPANPVVVEILAHEAEKNGVQLIYGSAESQVIQIRQLLEIL